MDVRTVGGSLSFSMFCLARDKRPSHDREKWPVKREKKEKRNSHKKGLKRIGQKSAFILLDS